MQKLTISETFLTGTLRHYEAKYISGSDNLRIEIHFKTKDPLDGKFGNEFHSCCR